MLYLIDTYNLVHAAAGLGGVLGQMTVRKLCQFLAASPGGKGGGGGGRNVNATLVLDGRAKPDEPGENEFPDITLVYSGAGVSADLVIGQLVERSKARRKITVVTNDRAVALHARQNFANAMSCETFLKMISQGMQGRAGTGGTGTGGAGKAEEEMVPGEVEHWMEEFGLQEGGRAGKTERKKGGDGKDDEKLEGFDFNIEDLLGPRS